MSFTSGPWTGYYLQPAKDDRRHPMDVTLVFREKHVSGHGEDDIGRFSIKGHCDETTAEVSWVKSYRTHQVWYRGFRELEFIWGTWELYSGESGGFKIWPKGQGEGIEAWTEADVEAPVLTGRGPGARASG